MDGNMESPEKAGKVNTRNGASLLLESASAFLPDEGSSSTSPPLVVSFQNERWNGIGVPRSPIFNPRPTQCEAQFQFPQQNSRDNINKTNWKSIAYATLTWWGAQLRNSKRTNKRIPEEMIHATAAEMFPALVEKPVSGDRLEFRWRRIYLGGKYGGLRTETLKRLFPCVPL